jgi:predicted phage-related endonuclease
MNPRDLIQGTMEWRLYRCGRATSSRMADLTAKTKVGWGASRANYMSDLLCERLTKIPTDSYSSGSMDWGRFTEPQARKEYEINTEHTVHCVGFVDHPSIEMAGCSPDGLIGDDGELQIKCPNTSTHVETLLGKPPEVPDKYQKQIQFGLACTGRQWCDYVSYDPRVPERMRLFIKRVWRDEEKIAYLEKCTRDFLDELAQKIAVLETSDRDVAREQLIMSAKEG